MFANLNVFYASKVHTREISELEERKMWKPGHTHGIRQNAMLKVALIMFTHTLRFLSLQTYHQILRGKYFFD